MSPGSPRQYLPAQGVPVPLAPATYYYLASACRGARKFGQRSWWRLPCQLAGVQPRTADACVVRTERQSSNHYIFAPFDHQNLGQLAQGKLHSVSSVFAKWQCCMRAAWYFSGSSSALPLFHRTSHARNRRCGALARLLTAAAGSDHKAKNRGPPDPAQTILGGTPVSQHAQQRRPISGPRTGTLVL